MNGADYTEYDERPGRDFVEYLEIPFRYPRHFWIAFLGILGIALILGLVLPRKYRSSTLILVESKSLPESFVAPVTAEGMAQRLNTIRQVVMSRTRLERVIQKLNPYPEMAGMSSFAQVEAMRRAIEIKVQGGDSFAIEYVNNNAEKAMDVTNMLATQFTEDAATLSENATKKAFGFIQNNLEDAKKAVEEREQALRRHKQKYWGSLPEQLDSNLRMLQQLQLEQQTLAGNLNTLEERRAVLERSLLEGRRLATSAGGGAAAELLKMRSAYNALRGRYTEEHPDMRALRARIDKLEKRLAETQTDVTAAKEDLPSDPEATSLSNSLRLVEGEIDALKTRRDQLDERIRAFQARVEETPRAEQELAALARDYQQLRQNYDVALKKEMDAEMAQRLEEYWKGGYFRVLDPAHLPRQPIRPYGTLLAIGGLALGLVAGLALTIIADLLDRSVKSERDLEDLLTSPVLVTIPRVGLQGKKAATA